MVNRGLSYFPDTILFANEMNKAAEIPKKWQFDFLLQSVSKKRRFSKWHKKDASTDSLKLIMKHYKYSENKAYAVIDLMSPDQLQELKQAYETGGRS
jgi:hypothetical protein